MNYLDWLVLFGTIAFIVLYGTWKTRKTSTVDGYIRGDNTMKWWMIGVSIMATQASAVTFLSTPGQAIEDGMRFLQFYFGLPLAMVIISVTMVPIYYKLKVYTAYEYLETRFDVKTRALAAILFLILRGLSAGITLFAPALVLSTILRWPISLTTVMIGTLVIIYVVSGGTKAVSLTQRQQMAVIMSGMILAGILALNLLPDHVSFNETVQIAGEMGKLNLVNLEFDPSDRYNIWSGLLAGTFLFLSYFGTDQSQVARYLGGSSVAESRLGLMFNGLLKIPMQFIILFIGVLVYVFYLFNQPPVFHNEVLKERALQTEQGQTIRTLETAYDKLYAEKRHVVDDLVNAIEKKDHNLIESSSEQIKALQTQETALRDSVKNTIGIALPGAKTQDRDYIFLNFVLNNLPHGIIGLLLAVMFSAAMSSMASELNALASTTSIDLYKRLIRPNVAPENLLGATRGFTVVWALLAMLFAMLASFAENLIQFVNIVGSLFYGTILGIFLTAFYFRRIGGTAVFVAAIFSEFIVLYCHFFTDTAYLLYNFIGCAGVIVISAVMQLLLPRQSSQK
ncbi:sodium:solute symporter [Fulvivirgaceae bacterium PWU4]|uniref:Sodium:solute symporter n=1 Tax=Chryseosolibacter histidini TaxID=2782349 RepID=A0AAP2DI25_9BACT|nr:sodium:solute symporter [Chryseosolibacter histidini]MBT1696783.1 sodium:solute symporter [Chryseosolibacter histidini]